MASSSRSATCALRTSILQAPSSSRSFSSSTAPYLEAKHYNPWTQKSHLKPAPSVPAPLPPLFAQRILLSDGSTFTSHTTCPTPAIVRLTRDVTNNPLWAPGTERRGVGDDDEGRVGRFKRMFEGMDTMGKAEGEVAMDGKKSGKGEVDDYGWMSEGGREEKAPPVKQAKGGQGKGKKK